MPKAEKIIVFCSSILLILFFIGMIYAVRELNILLPTCITSVEPFKTGKVIKHTEDKYEIQYVARMWNFDPAVVEVPVGATIDFYVTSLDVIHGFHILGTNVNLMAVPGTVNYIQKKFLKAGEYSILCHEYCGMGHQMMSAKIMVK
ncbi:MAG: cytochrome C oxidase subunit II [Deltaproteobacteria bacterium GWA2_38_16]|nr:MAG: cytochrome C oxidase subunit II [Deltaproteobacteria bacterium GWA2_38_16]OGQ02205.1 MAG: cytochrome C oxidase subunit II [Deltaproteobacteria bacterium RIFCSPHIGHO2_02_FULL_38_15]OGQ33727.1 MAG: cytochrome C oxidase subunit II [Deltaproteobacteria bacterium RIFCSPLOWO2_01_FULL_38_9]OGQ60622.1 MAG: cytochrome C oxidase subunit II [Deltaproteobacteria bacterium RIFCSPLOWO2_12_FULL_38_8]HBQ22003.1 cytochrome C oxidase subunit II [Deltaproteobacteria bacterium]